MQLKHNIQVRFGSLQIEWVAFALFLSAYVTLLVFGNASINLESINDLELNQATQYGIDVSKRVSIFNQAVVLSLLLLLVFVWLLNDLLRRFDWMEKLSSDVFFGATIGLTAIAVQLAGFKDDYLTHIVPLLLVARIMIYGIGMNTIQLKWFKSASIFALHCVLSFNVFVIVQLLGSKQIGTYFVPLFLLILCVIYSIVSLIRLQLKSFRHIYFILLPISLIPLALFIGIELQVFWITHFGVALGYKKLIVALIGCFTLITSIVYYLNRKRIIRSVGRFNTWITYPLAVFLIVLLRYYSPFITSPHELFELANPANTILRIHQFHEIPFVDFMSSHLFSEQWFGILYSLIFGFNGSLDFMSWEFLNVFLHFLICFFLIKQLSNTAFYAFVFVACMAWLQDVFFGPVIFAIPLFFALEHLWKKQTIRNYLLLMFLLIFSCLWRLDTGYATCIATGMYSLICLLIRTDVSFKVKLILKTLAFTLLISLGIFAVIFIIKGFNYPFMSHVKSFIHYISGSQTHGRPSITGGSSVLDFKMNHLVFPMLGVIGISATIYAIAKGKQTILLKAALYLYLLYFSNVQRGLVRHGFAEQNEQFLMSTFILASSLLLIYLFKINTAAKQIGLLFAFTSLLYMTLKVFPTDETPSAFHQTIEAGLIQRFPKQLDHPTKHGRILIEDTSYSYPKLSAFLNKNLKQGETFFDFSNSPMLYFYSQRSIPGYFNQPLQNTVGEAAQYELIQQIDKQSIPIVIYSSEPLSYFDAIDNIHNTQRYHLIASYIHKHYTPLLELEGKVIWVRKKHALAKKAISNYVPKKQGFYLGQFPYFAQEFYKQHQKSFQSLNHIRLNNNQLVVPGLIQKKDQILISIQATSHAKRNHPLHVYLINRNNTPVTHLGLTVFHSSAKSYLVRLSNSYSWSNDTITKLRFSSTDSIQVKKVTFIKDIRFENR